MKKAKKFLAAVLTAVMAFTGTMAVSPEILPTTIEASAVTGLAISGATLKGGGSTVVANDSGGININGFRDGKYEGLSGNEVEVFGEEAEDILKMFGLDKIEHSYWDPTWHKIVDSVENINYPYYEIWRDKDGSSKIPSSYRTSIKIENAAKADRIVLDTVVEEYLTVTNEGVLTANYSNDIDVVNYDQDYMRIYYDNKYVTIYLNIRNYTKVEKDQWINDKIAEYMDSHTNSSMSDYEKMEVALKWLQKFPYECPGTSVYDILQGTGGGDCWTYPEFIKYISDYMGWKCKTREADIDRGATITHKNSSVELDGKIYIVDIGTKARNYWLVELGNYSSELKTGYSSSADGFIYKEYSKGVEIYNYLGFEENVVIPDTINGKPVSIIDNYAFDFQSTYPVHTLTVPDTVVGRILGDLPYSPNVHVVTSSGTVLQEGLYNADGSVKTVDVSELYFCGIASNYDYTGKAVTPEPIMLYPYSFDGTPEHWVNIKLTKGVDYTVSYSNNVKAGTATVTIKGIGGYTGTVSKTFKINPCNHSYKTTKTVSPTLTAKGYTLKTCSICGTETKTSYTAKLISMSKCKATISKSSYAYTGKAVKPTVTVKYGSTKLTKGTDYTVSYKNNTKTGKATITVKGKGKYSGTLTKTFNIVPKKATLSSVTSSKTKNIKVTWKKDTQATGYEIVYATNSKFKSSKTVTVSKNSTVTKTISKLTKGKTYYVKVRSYKTINGKKVYGAYSAVKKVKCK